MLALAQFAVRMICGMSLVLAAMPRSAVASGFFRVQMLIVMGLGVLAVLADQSLPQDSATGTNLRWLHITLSVGLAILGFVASVFWTLERRTGAGRMLAGIVLIALSALSLGVIMMTQTDRPAHWTLILGSELSSALTLGSAMCGMLLGHSYLTSPTMSISPLLRLNTFLGWAGIVRGILSSVVLILAFQQLESSGVWTWLSLRWIAGVFGPILVWQMVFRILAYRNTQAATGVLFVGVILTLLGELTGTLLLSATGWPL